MQVPQSFLVTEFNWIVSLNAIFYYIARPLQKVINRDKANTTIKSSASVCLQQSSQQRPWIESFLISYLNNVDCRQQLNLQRILKYSWLQCLCQTTYCLHCVAWRYVTFPFYRCLFNNGGLWEKWGFFSLQYQEWPLVKTGSEAEQRHCVHV